MTITVGKERLVPYVTSWTGEEEFWLGELYGSPAVMQREAQGQGEPQFEYPHIMRQRKAMTEDLCGVCGKPMKNSTKVMMGTVSFVEMEGEKIPVFVTPYSHRKCALQMIDNDPSIIGKLISGEMQIIQSFGHVIVGETLSPEGTLKLLGKAEPVAVAHLKMGITNGHVKDMNWLKLIGLN